MQIKKKTSEFSQSGYTIMYILSMLAVNSVHTPLHLTVYGKFKPCLSYKIVHDIGKNSTSIIP